MASNLKFRALLLGGFFLISNNLRASSMGGIGDGSSAIGTLPPAFYSLSGSYFYVAPYGRDTSVCGSLTEPCQTINYVDQNLLTNGSGAIVLLRGGIYYLPSVIAPTKSGNAGPPAQPIVYAAYPNEVPILTGARPLSGWTQSCSGAYAGVPNCWTTKVPAGFVDFDYLLYLPAGWPPTYVASAISRRGESMNPVTNPALGPYNSNAGVPGSCTPTCTTEVMVDGQILNAPSLYNANDIKYYNFNEWDVDVLRVDSATYSIGTNTTTLIFKGPASVHPGNQVFVENGVNNRYLIVNSRDYFISKPTPGTFYIDCGTIAASPGACIGQGTNSNGQAIIGGSSTNDRATVYYIAQNGEHPDTDLILAPQLPQLVADAPTTGSYNGAGVNYLKYQGLTFIGDNFVTPLVGYPSISGQPTIPAALSFVNTTGVVVDSTVIAHTSGWGLEFTNNCSPSQPQPPTCSNTVSAPSNANSLTNSALYDIGASGLRLGRYPPQPDDQAGGNSQSNATNNTTVSNNIFYGTGRIYPNGEDGCIWIGSSWNNDIEHNECGDSYGGGIAVGPGVGFTKAFEFNNVVKFNNFHDLGAGVISDFGCVHFATGAGAAVSSMGDSFQNNICSNITHTPHDLGNGGTGIYIDNNSENVNASYNLVYRASGALFFNNASSPACSLTSGGGFTGCNNLVSNNIFAFSGQGPIKRGSVGGVGDAFQDFTFQQNVVYFGASQQTSSGPQWLPPPGNTSFGSWDCDIDPTQPTFLKPCTRYFNFASNGYYSRSLALSVPIFVTVNTKNTRSLSTWNGLGAWQTTTGTTANYPGEDEAAGGGNAVYADPQFVGPNYAVNDFHFQSTAPGSVANTINFSVASFANTYTAGRNNALIFPPPVAPTFPLQLLSPFQF